MALSSSEAARHELLGRREGVEAALARTGEDPQDWQTIIGEAYALQGFEGVFVVIGT